MRPHQVGQFGQHVVVDRLTGQVVDRHANAKAVVDRLEVLGREVDQDLPEPQGLGIARLKRHHTGTRTVGEVVGRIECLSGLAVEPVEVAERQFGNGVFFAEVGQVLDQHAEGCAPVADMVLADHRVALRFKDAHQRIADHRRPQVATCILATFGAGDDHPLRRMACLGLRVGNRRAPVPNSPTDGAAEELRRG